MVLPKLAISYLLVRKIRSALTIAAIALSVSLVVAVTSGYASLQSAAERYLNTIMGTADAFVLPGNDLQGKIPQSLVDELRGDAEVRKAVGRLEAQRVLQLAPNDKSSKHLPHPDRSEVGGLAPDQLNVTLTGVDPIHDSQIDTLKIVSGSWFTDPTATAVVLDQVAAEKLKLNVGDTVQIPGIDGTESLTVAGIIHKPTFFGAHAATAYVPLQTLQKFTHQDHPPQVSRIAIDLNSGVNLDAFSKRWRARLAKIDTNLTLRMRQDNGGEVDKKFLSLRILSYFGGTISMVTAMFIIFSTLAMGVSERQRTLAMLRAIGTTRGQVARLVVIDGLLLSIAGIIAGILLGMFWTWLLCHHYHEMFINGPVFSWLGVIFAASGSLLTALAASLLPAWTASRVSPLEAMNAYENRSSGSATIGWAIAGLILIGIDPFIFFTPIESIFAHLHVQDPLDAARTFQLIGHFLFGLPGILIGFFLLAPLVIRILEKVCAPILAGILHLPVKLLRQQLSSGVWRSAGSAAALMVGLATLIAMQVQGTSLIASWPIPDKFPDIFIYGSDIITWKDQQKLADIPGIEPGTLMPCVVTTPLGDSLLSLGTATALGQNNIGVLFFAVNPAQALRMVQLEFRDNDGRPYPQNEQYEKSEQVVQEMKKGRQILVTDEFRQAKHLKIGDKFRILTSKDGLQDYTICGIVSSPGADFLISLYDLGHAMDQQTAGSVFGRIEDAKRDFGVQGARLFAANLTGGIDKNDLLKNVQKALGDRGLKAGDVRQLKFYIQDTFSHILLLLSSIALAALAVASLGVANTLIASVRSRRWQFGVLRSVGVTRGELLRLVFAEAALLGLVGIAIGCGAGAEISIFARLLAGVMVGTVPPVVIPWGIIVFGCAAVMFVALLASLWPAITTARTQVLELLQAGRASS